MPDMDGSSGYKIPPGAGVASKKGGIVHRKDAKDAEGNLFSLAVERTASEKIHFIWDIALMTDF